MKKLLLSFFILFCLQYRTANAQWVTIPDANFVAKLTQLYPSCMNGNQMDTTCSAIVNATFINLYYLNISNLSGIEYFDNLTLLNCFNGTVTTIPELPNSLEHFNCRNNSLSSLPALPSTLKILYCDHNQLTGLPNLPNGLTDLDCSFNEIDSLPTLPDSLQILMCSNNPQITLPSSLPASLNKLECDHNDLTSLPILPNSLHILKCHANLLSSLPALPDSLQYLQIGYNYFSTIPTLPNSLEFLDCSFQNAPLITLPALPSSLISLACVENQLTSIPALPNTLQHLNCEFNQLTSLPPLPSTLSTLGCNYNQITSMPALPNVMQDLQAFNNNITCFVNLPIITGSSAAHISNNPLTCVPNQTNYSLGLPLCVDNDTINNPNNCPGVNIAGYVFTDLDTNCTYDNTDLPTQNIPVKLFDTQNNLLATSYTVNGVYSFANLQPDSFQVKIEDNLLPVAVACGQSNIQSLQLDSANQSLLGHNFPVVCDSAFDLKVQSVVSLGWVFPGQIHTLKTNITSNETWYNLDCGSSNYSGTVNIQVIGQYTYISPAPNALTPLVNGNTFTYTINDYSEITPNSFNLLLLVDTTAQIDQQICVNVDVTSIPSDANSINNSYTLCYYTLNSYDPNMKEVYPVNVLPGYDDWFTYTIHFQNTGNAPAFNIRLSDTLDANLDINSFEVRGYSHPATISLNGNILTVRVNNIMLPDSTTDYEGSMGYFQYRLKPLANLPNGTQIENTAYIYFDFNAPIVTNTTVNNFDMTVKTNNIKIESEHYVIYPNPSTGLFMFKESKGIQTIEVFNMMGELVLSQGNAKIINLQAFPKGIYMARINGTQVCRLVKE